MLAGLWPLDRGPVLRGPADLGTPIYTAFLRDLRARGVKNTAFLASKSWRHVFFRVFRATGGLFAPPAPGGRRVDFVAISRRCAVFGLFEAPPWQGLCATLGKFCQTPKCIFVAICVTCALSAFCENSLEGRFCRYLRNLRPLCMSWE